MSNTHLSRHFDLFYFEYMIFGYQRSGIPTAWIVKVVMRYFVGHRVIDSGQCPQFVDDLSGDPMVMFENVDHVSITSTRQNTF